MGSHLGLTTEAKSSSIAIPQALPGKVLQEADNYSTAKREDFRRLAVMQMESNQAQGGEISERSSNCSKWDVLRNTVSLRNQEFLSTLLQTDSLNPDAHGQQVDLATQQTVLVEE